ncbi:hypothetical protein A9Q74_08185 [Colwellia sp. 39_35_sub15_T18]|nr:hypothetical protein A9Q74_08185 [Colwellia sp. 39_35_sub15_T18]
MKKFILFILCVALSGCITSEHLEMYNAAHSAAPVGDEITALKKEAKRRCDSYGLINIELNKCIDEQYDKLHAQHVEAAKAENSTVIRN